MKAVAASAHATGGAATARSASLQRKSDCCESCERDDDRSAQRKPSSASFGGAGDVFEREANRAAESVAAGRPLGTSFSFTSVPTLQKKWHEGCTTPGTSGSITSGPLNRWEYVVYEDHVRLGNRVFDKSTHQVIGSWPWMTNNPGDITVDTKASREKPSAQTQAFDWGAIPGVAANTGVVPLAIFPDMSTGFSALVNLLSTPAYVELTLDQAVERHLGGPSKRLAGIDDPKTAVDRIIFKLAQLGVKADAKTRLSTLRDNANIGKAAQAFGFAEGVENPGLTYRCDGRDKADDAKIPLTVRNLQIFKSVPDQPPSEVKALLCCDTDGAQKKAEHDPEEQRDPVSAIDALRDAGEPMDPATQAFMEDRFGFDFSGVRIHADASAAASARQQRAHAYTVGRDIVFANGRYAPQTRAGRELLAHELAHTVQQGAVRQRTPDRNTRDAATASTPFRPASPGVPIDAPLRDDMERRFGRDFSQVRIHTGDAAAASAASAGARAYTVGSSIVFAKDRYAPASAEGRALIAHELAHVVQQSSSGAVASTDVLEAEARTAGESALSGRDILPTHAATGMAPQFEEEAAGVVQVIAKENGLVAVVLVRGGKIVRGYAEIKPPRGMSARDAAPLVRTRVTGTGPNPKVAVILPQEWKGPQATNRAAPVRVIDTATADQEDEQAKHKAKREQYVSDLRANFREYMEDLTHGEFVDPMLDYRSETEILALQANQDFLKWLQRKRLKADYKAFREQRLAEGISGEEDIKDMWKTFRLPKLSQQETMEVENQALKYDTEKALTQNFATPMLLGWMAGKPKPVEEVDANGAKVTLYKLQLPDGNVATFSQAQFDRLRGEAKRKIETMLNTVQNDKDRYEFHRNDRGWASRGLDTVYGADLEGKNWKAIDAAVQAGRDALKKGDVETSLARLAEAQKLEAAARKEWDRYLHNREVGAEVTITGLEVVKGASEVALAIGTAPLGGVGIIIVAGKGVTESVVMATLKSQGEHVDWGDVAFDVSTQVVTAAAGHGLGKVMALGPKSAFMNLLRENAVGQIGADVAQTILLDAAQAAAKAEYEHLRGRGEHPSAADIKAHFLKYLEDPSTIGKQILESQIQRHTAHHVAGILPLKRAPKAPKAASATTTHEATSPKPAHDEHGSVREGSQPGQEAPSPARESSQPAQAEGATARTVAPAPIHGEPHVNVEVGGDPSPKKAGAPSSKETGAATHSAPEAGDHRQGKPAAEHETIKKPGAGGHEVEVTTEKTAVCSPGPCPNLAVEYIEELKTSKEHVAELKEIIKLRKTEPGKAAERAAALQVKLEGIRADAAKVAGGKSDVGLADQGYRPAPGERGESRHDYKKRRGGERWAQAVEQAFAGDITGRADVPRVKGGASNPRVDNKAVPGAPRARLDLESVPRRQGETPMQALDRVKSVIGKKISDHPALERMWNDARAAVTKKNALSQSNYADLYDRTREAFWRRVRRDPKAMAIMKDAGFDLAGGKTSAPVLDGVGGNIPVEELRISLDHIEEKAQGNNWQKALDADNLRLEFSQPNTEREVKQMRHPELRQSGQTLATPANQTAPATPLAVDATAAATPKPEASPAADAGPAKPDLKPRFEDGKIVWRTEAEWKARQASAAERASPQAEQEALAELEAAQAEAEATAPPKKTLPTAK